MSVNTTWTDPSTGGTIDLGTGEVLTEVVWDKVLSNLKALGGTAGDFTGGWQAANQSWSYASATTITVPSGAASIYSVGDKIKLTQTSAKYFYIVGVADTVLTVTGGKDYTVANEAITLPYYSKAASPVGFPQWFSYTPTITVSGGTAPTYTEEFTNIFFISGRNLTVMTEWINTAGGTAGNGSNPIVVTLPVPVARSSTWVTGSAHYQNGATVETGYTIEIDSSGSGYYTFNDYYGIDVKGTEQNDPARKLKAVFTYEI